MCWRGWGEKGTLLHFWCKCKLMQSLRKSVWRVFKKLGIKLSYDPTISILGICPEKTITEKDTRTSMFIAALFTIARTWKQPRCPSTDEWIKKVWHTYAVDYCHCSVTQSCMTLWPHGLQYARLPCPSLSQHLLKLMSIELMMPSNHLILCHPLLFLPSIFRWGSFPMSQLMASGGKSVGVSATVLPMNIQGWFPLGLTGWISLLSRGLLQHHSSKASILRCSDFFMAQLSHPYMTTGKTIALTIQTFVGKVMALLFNTLCRFFIVFLPRSKHLSI